MDRLIQFIIDNSVNQTARANKDVLYTDYRARLGLGPNETSAKLEIQVSAHYIHNLMCEAIEVMIRRAKLVDEVIYVLNLENGIIHDLPGSNKHPDLVVWNATRRMLSIIDIKTGAHKLNLALRAGATRMEYEQEFSILRRFGLSLDVHAEEVLKGHQWKTFVNSMQKDMGYGITNTIYNALATTYTNRIFNTLEANFMSAMQFVYDEDHWEIFSNVIEDNIPNEFMIHAEESMAERTTMNYTEFINLYKTFLSNKHLLPKMVKKIMYAAYNNPKMKDKFENPLTQIKELIIKYNRMAKAPINNTKQQYNQDIIPPLLYDEDIKSDRHMSDDWVIDKSFSKDRELDENHPNGRFVDFFLHHANHMASEKVIKSDHYTYVPNSNLYTYAENKKTNDTTIPDRVKDEAIKFKLISDDDNMPGWHDTPNGKIDFTKAEEYENFQNDLQDLCNEMGIEHGVNNTNKHNLLSKHNTVLRKRRGIYNLIPNWVAYDPNRNFYVNQHLLVDDITDIMLHDYAAKKTTGVRITTRNNIGVINILHAKKRFANFGLFNILKSDTADKLYELLKNSDSRRTIYLLKNETNPEIKMLLFLPTTVAKSQFPVWKRFYAGLFMAISLSFDGNNIDTDLLNGFLHMQWITGTAVDQSAHVIDGIQMLIKAPMSVRLNIVKEFEKKILARSDDYKNTGINWLLYKVITTFQTSSHEFLKYNAVHGLEFNNDGSLKLGRDVPIPNMGFYFDITRANRLTNFMHGMYAMRMMRLVNGMSQHPEKVMRQILKERRTRVYDYFDTMKNSTNVYLFEPGAKPGTHVTKRIIEPFYALYKSDLLIAASGKNDFTSHSNFIALACNALQQDVVNTRTRDVFPAIIKDADLFSCPLSKANAHASVATDGGSKEFRVEAICNHMAEVYSNVSGTNVNVDTYSNLSYICDILIKIIKKHGYVCIGGAFLKEEKLKDRRDIEYTNDVINFFQQVKNRFASWCSTSNHFAKFSEQSEYLYQQIANKTLGSMDAHLKRTGKMIITSADQTKYSPQMDGLNQMCKTAAHWFFFVSHGMPKFGAMWMTHEMMMANPNICYFNDITNFGSKLFSHYVVNANIEQTGFYVIKNKKTNKSMELSKILGKFCQTKKIKRTYLEHHFRQYITAFQEFFDDEYFLSNELDVNARHLSKDILDFIKEFPEGVYIDPGRFHGLDQHMNTEAQVLIFNIVLKYMMEFALLTHPYTEETNENEIRPINEIEAMNHRRVDYNVSIYSNKLEGAAPNIVDLKYNGRLIAQTCIYVYSDDIRIFTLAFGENEACAIVETWLNLIRITVNHVANWTKVMISRSMGDMIGTTVILELYLALFMTRVFDLAITLSTIVGKVDSRDFICSNVIAGHAMAIPLDLLCMILAYHSVHIDIDTEFSRRIQLNATTVDTWCKSLKLKINTQHVKNLNNVVGKSYNERIKAYIDNHNDTHLVSDIIFNQDYDIHHIVPSSVPYFVLDISRYKDNNDALKLIIAREQIYNACRQIEIYDEEQVMESSVNDTSLHFRIKSSRSRKIQIIKDSIDQLEDVTVKVINNNSKYQYMYQKLNSFKKSTQSILTQIDYNKVPTNPYITYVYIQKLRQGKMEQSTDILEQQLGYRALLKGRSVYEVPTALFNETIIEGIYKNVINKTKAAQEVKNFLSSIASFRNSQANVNTKNKIIKDESIGYLLTGKTVQELLEYERQIWTGKNSTIRYNTYNSDGTQLGVTSKKIHDVVKVKSPRIKMFLVNDMLRELRVRFNDIKNAMKNNKNTDEINQKTINKVIVSVVKELFLEDLRQQEIKRQYVERYPDAKRIKSWEKQKTLTDFYNMKKMKEYYDPEIITGWCELKEVLSINVTEKEIKIGRKNAKKTTVSYLNSYFTVSELFLAEWMMILSEKITNKQIDVAKNSCDIISTFHNLDLTLLNNITKNMPQRLDVVKQHSLFYTQTPEKIMNAFSYSYNEKLYIDAVLSDPEKIDTIKEYLSLTGIPATATTDEILAMSKLYSTMLDSNIVVSIADIYRPPIKRMNYKGGSDLNASFLVRWLFENVNSNFFDVRNTGAMNAYEKRDYRHDSIILQKLTCLAIYQDRIGWNWQDYLNLVSEDNELLKFLEIFADISDDNPIFAFIHYCIKYDMNTAWQMINTFPRMVMKIKDSKQMKTLPMRDWPKNINIASFSYIMVLNGIAISFIQSIEGFRVIIHSRPKQMPQRFLNNLRTMLTMNFRVLININSTFWLVRLHDRSGATSWQQLCNILEKKHATADHGYVTNEKNNWDEYVGFVKTNIDNNALIVPFAIDLYGKIYNTNARYPNTYPFPYITFGEELNIDHEMRDFDVYFDSDDHYLRVRILNVEKEIDKNLFTRQSNSIDLNLIRPGKTINLEYKHPSLPVKLQYTRRYGDHLNTVMYHSPESFKSSVHVKMFTKFRIRDKTYKSFSDFRTTFEIACLNVLDAIQYEYDEQIEIPDICAWIMVQRAILTYYELCIAIANDKYGRSPSVDFYTLQDKTDVPIYVSLVGNVDAIKQFYHWGRPETRSIDKIASTLYSYMQAIHFINNIAFEKCRRHRHIEFEPLIIAKELFKQVYLSSQMYSFGGLYIQNSEKSIIYSVQTTNLATIDIDIQLGGRDYTSEYRQVMSLDTVIERFEFIKSKIYFDDIYTDNQNSDNYNEYLQALYQIPFFFKNKNYHWLRSLLNKKNVEELDKDIVAGQTHELDYLIVICNAPYNEYFNIRLQLGLLAELIPYFAARIQNMDENPVSIFGRVNTIINKNKHYFYPKTMTYNGTTVMYDKARNMTDVISEVILYVNSGFLNNEVDVQALGDTYGLSIDIREYIDRIDTYRRENFYSIRKAKRPTDMISSTVRWAGRQLLHVPKYYGNAFVTSDSINLPKFNLTRTEADIVMDWLKHNREVSFEKIKEFISLYVIVWNKNTSRITTNSSILEICETLNILEFVNIEQSISYVKLMRKYDKVMFAEIKGYNPLKWTAVAISSSANYPTNSTILSKIVYKDRTFDASIIDNNRALVWMSNKSSDPKYRGHEAVKLTYEFLSKPPDIEMENLWEICWSCLGSGNNVSMVEYYRRTDENILKYLKTIGIPDLDRFLIFDESAIGLFSRTCSVSYDEAANVARTMDIACFELNIPYIGWLIDRAAKTTETKVDRYFLALGERRLWFDDYYDWPDYVLENGLIDAVCTHLLSGTRPMDFAELFDMIKDFSANVIEYKQNIAAEAQQLYDDVLTSAPEEEKSVFIQLKQGSKERLINEMTTIMAIIIDATEDFQKLDTLRNLKCNDRKVIGTIRKYEQMITPDSVEDTFFAYPDQFLSRLYLILGNTENYFQIKQVSFYDMSMDEAYPRIIAYLQSTIGLLEVYLNSLETG